MSRVLVLREYEGKRRLGLIGHTFSWIYLDPAALHAATHSTWDEVIPNTLLHIMGKYA